MQAASENFIIYANILQIFLLPYITSEMSFFTYFQPKETRFCPYPNCRYIYYTIRRLNDHIKMWHPPKPFRCATCHSKFDDYNSLVRHQDKNSHFGGIVGQVLCIYCMENLFFEREWMWTLHMAIHDNQERSFMNRWLRQNGVEVQIILPPSYLPSKPLMDVSHSQVLLGGQSSTSKRYICHRLS